MGVAEFETDVPFDPGKVPIAAVLARTPHGNLHAGLLYRGAEGGRHALHLGWQDNLQETWPLAVLWVTPDDEPELLNLAASYCRLVWATFVETRKFPYALMDEGVSLDEKGGIVLSDGAHGLTCATIIIAIFARAGIELVVRDTWPIRKDLDHKFLELAARFTASWHLELLKSEVEAGVKRVHPDEVVAACTCVLPAEFTQARSAADALVAKLDAATI